MEKLWGGRFQETAEAWVEQFGASIHFDAVLAPYDLQGSLAHVKMLKKQKILSEHDADCITAGLERLQKQLTAGTLRFDVSAEDIHLNMEQLLTAEIGPVAGKLHTGRSRNDQVATDMHLYLKDQVTQILKALHACRTMFVEKAAQHVETILPGLTHLQHAQPISLGHHFLAYYEMLTRDAARLQDAQKRIDLSPLGAAALAGTTFPLDRSYSAECLGFSDVYANSLDAVSDRDFILEFMSAAVLCMMHLSRFCEELILWSSHEYRYIEIADAFSTGSSIMPQKKNPDMAELIRGKSGRVYGNLVGLLTIMKGLPLAYNKDLQEDKEGMFDTVETLKGSLPILTGMLESLTVNEERMFTATTQDFSNATELADYLATLDIPFRQAHEIVGKLVLQCTQAGNYLQDIPLADYQAIHPAITDDVYRILASKTAVNRRNTLGGTGFKQVQAAVLTAQQQLASE